MKYTVIIDQSLRPTVLNRTEIVVNLQHIFFTSKTVKWYFLSRNIVVVKVLFFILTAFIWLMCWLQVTSAGCSRCPGRRLWRNCWSIFPSSTPETPTLKTSTSPSSPPSCHTPPSMEPSSRRAGSCSRIRSSIRPSPARSAQSSTCGWATWTNASADRTITRPHCRPIQRTYKVKARLKIRPTFIHPLQWITILLVVEVPKDKCHSLISLKMAQTRYPRTWHYRSAAQWEVLRWWMDGITVVALETVLGCISLMTTWTWTVKVTVTVAARVTCTWMGGVRRRGWAWQVTCPSRPPSQPRPTLTPMCRPHPTHVHVSNQHQHSVSIKYLMKECITPYMWDKFVSLWNIFFALLLLLCLQYAAVPDIFMLPEKFRGSI